MRRVASERINLSESEFVMRTNIVVTNDDKVRSCTHCATLAHHITIVRDGGEAYAQYNCCEHRVDAQKIVFETLLYDETVEGESPCNCKD
jgi:hypothetical protein